LGQLSQIQTQGLAGAENHFLTMDYFSRKHFFPTIFLFLTFVSYVLGDLLFTKRQEERFLSVGMEIGNFKITFPNSAIDDKCRNKMEGGTLKKKDNDDNIDPNDYFRVALEKNNNEVTVYLTKVPNPDKHKYFRQIKLEVIISFTDSSCATITGGAEITIKDTNNNSPVFEEASKTLKIKENTPNKKLQIKATDLDFTTETNGRVTYELKSVTPTEYQDAFALDTDTGELTINKEFDRETVQKITLQVAASDNPGTTPDTPKDYGRHTVTEEITIHILDENDNPPTSCRLDPPTCSVQETTVETTPPLTILEGCQVVCMDPDSVPIFK
jgi:hypothetical protein